MRPAGRAAAMAPGRAAPGPARRRRRRRRGVPSGSAGYGCIRFENTRQKSEDAIIRQGWKKWEMMGTGCGHGEMLSTAGNLASRTEPEERVPVGKAE